MNVKLNVFKLANNIAVWKKITKTLALNVGVVYF